MWSPLSVSGFSWCHKSFTPLEPFIILSFQTSMLVSVSSLVQQLLPTSLSVLKITILTTWLFHYHVLWCDDVFSVMSCFKLFPHREAKSSNFILSSCIWRMHHISLQLTRLIWIKPKNTSLVFTKQLGLNNTQVLCFHWSNLSWSRYYIWVPK